jgi:hypothetical protein
MDKLLASEFDLLVVYTKEGCLRETLEKEAEER